MVGPKVKLYLKFEAEVRGPSWEFRRNLTFYKEVQICERKSGYGTDGSGYRWLILHTRICAPISDRNIAPAETGDGARIQSEILAHS